MADLGIPLAYRALFLYIEPTLALFGTAVLLLQPERYLLSLTDSAVYHTDNKVVYANLGATYALFAFNEFIVLRVTNDIRVWNAVLTGILLCDCIHLYASWATLGPSIFWNPTAWRQDDWITIGSYYVQGLFRIAFLAGLGFKKSPKAKKI
jgi:hypothetical protein